MTYKYEPLGLNLGGTIGKVTWYHDECAKKMDCVAGSHPFKTDEIPPKGTRCYWCGHEIVIEILTEEGKRRFKQALEALRTEEPKPFVPVEDGE